MAYTREQVLTARCNNDELKDCPDWLKRMFREAPATHTLSEGCHGWDSNFCGNCLTMVYRISDEWPPESEILPDSVPVLKPVEMWVSDSSVDWFKAFVIGQLGDEFITLPGHNHYERWAYAKPITEQEFSATITIPHLTNEVDKDSVRLAIKFGIADCLKVESGVQVVQVEQVEQV